MTRYRAGVVGALFAVSTAVSTTGAQSPSATVSAGVDGVRRTVAPLLASETERPVVLRRPASAVALALGNVGAVLTDADVLFYNPAMLPQAAGVAASLQRDGDAATGGALASVQSLGGLSVGVGARVVAWRGPSPDAPPSVGAPVGPSATSVALTAGAGRALGPLRVGASATYARESGDLRQDETMTVDAGVTLPFGPGNALNVALLVQHLGRPIARDFTFGDEEPWRAVVAFGGRSYPLATFWDLSAVTQLAVDADGTVRTAGGVELAWVPVEGVSFALRGGRRAPRDFERAYTAGLGLSLDRWSLDYALDPRRDGTSAHRVGVRIR